MDIMACFIIGELATPAAYDSESISVFNSAFFALLPQAVNEARAATATATIVSFFIMLFIFVFWFLCLSIVPIYIRRSHRSPLPTGWVAQATRFCLLHLQQLNVEDEG